ncbi:MAG: NAD(P)-binding domain-containing protein [Devosia sp.]|nr:NAD(P)-binding domain-containing protein [Devosia sp.]
MTYSIIGTGQVGRTLAAIFQKSGLEVGLANSRGVDVAGPIAKEVGSKIVAKSVEGALEADIIVFAVPFLKFKEIGALRSDWTGKIVVDVTNAFMLPQDVKEAELSGQPSSQVNSTRVPGAKLVKAFNQLPMTVLASAVPDGGRRVIFTASDDPEAAAAVGELIGNLGLAPIYVGKIAEGGLLIQARNALVFQNLIKFDR